MNRPLRIAVIAGEESGELLAADLVEALRVRSGREIELVGVGGSRLAALGLESLFPSHDIALMGIGAVVRDLPRLIRRIGSTAKSIVEARPDCLITVDSPEFTLRVSRKVRAADPSIPIVHYVCPSVWAWRQGRARDMHPHVDLVLCHLPFEPAELDRLGGPPGIFVGHRLTSVEGIRIAWEAQRGRRVSADGDKTLLVLPGSRRSEVAALIEPFGEAIDILRARGSAFRLLMPTVARLDDTVRQATANWGQKPEIIVGDDEKWRAFAQADAALCASGTVSLELALAGVPIVPCYKLDWAARMMRGLIKTWTIVLPNLIADRAIVREFVDFMVRPDYLARQLEALMSESELRRWQVAGFEEVWRRMSTDRPAGALAAEATLELIARKIA